jgi:hypothetical protein
MAGRATTGWRYEYGTTYGSDKITSAAAIFSKMTEEFISLQGSYQGTAFFVLAAPASFSAQNGAQIMNIPMR